MAYFETLGGNWGYEIATSVVQVSNVEVAIYNNVTTETRVSGDRYNTYVDTTTRNNHTIRKTVYYNANQLWVTITGDYHYNVGDILILIWYNGGNEFLAIKNKTNGEIYFYKSVEKYFKENFGLLPVSLKDDFAMIVGGTVVGGLCGLAIHFLLPLIPGTGWKILANIVVWIIMLSGSMMGLGGVAGLLRDVFYLLFQRKRVIKGDNFRRHVRENNDYIRSL